MTCPRPSGPPPWVGLQAQTPTLAEEFDKLMHRVSDAAFRRTYYLGAELARRAHDGDSTAAAFWRGWKI